MISPNLLLGLEDHQLVLFAWQLKRIVQNAFTDGQKEDGMDALIYHIKKPIIILTTPKPLFNFEMLSEDELNI